MPEAVNKKAEKSLYDLLFTLSEEAFVIIALDGRLKDYNKAAEIEYKEFFNIRLVPEIKLLEKLNAARPEIGAEVFKTLINNDPRSELLLQVSAHYSISLISHSIPFEKQNCRLIKLKKVVENRPEYDSKSFYIKLLDNAYDGIAITTADEMEPQIIYANKAYEEITGYSFKELKGRNPKFLQGPKTDPTVIAELSKALKENKDFFGYTYNYKKNGQEFVNEWGITSLKTENGKCYYLSILRDVTERENLKQNLKKSELRFRNTFENMAEGLIFQDKEGKIVEYNKSAEAHLGLSHAQLFGRYSYDPRWKAVTADGKPFPGELHPISRSRTTGEEINDEIMGITTPDGKQKWFSVNSRPTLDLDNRIIGAFCSFQDITKLVDSRKEIELSENKYKTLFEHNPNPIFITNPSEGKIVDCNTEALLHYGYTKEVLLKKTYKEFTVATNKNDSVPTELIHQTISKKIYVQDYARDIELHGAKYKLHLIHDISEKKAAEYKIASRDRQLKKLAINSPSIVFAVGKDNKLNVVYGNLLQQLKLTHLDLINKDIKEILAANDASIIQKEKYKINGEYRYTVKWNKLYLQIVISTFDHQHEVKSKVGVVTDITEQFETNQKITRLAHELNMGQKIASMGTWQYNLNTESLYWSETTYNIHEVPLDFEPDLTKAINFYKKEERKSISQAFEKLINEGEPYDLELQIITAKGNIKWVRSQGSLIEINDEATEVYGTFHDITEKKQLKDDRLKLASIIKYTTNEIFIYDVETLKPTFINQSALTNLHYNELDFPQISAATILNNYSSNRFREEIINQLNETSTKARYYSFKHARKDGTLYDVDASVQLMELQDKQVAVVIANDVTAKKRDRKRRELINTVNELIVNSGGNEDFIQEIIAVIADILDLRGGEYWEFNADRGFNQKTKWSVDEDLCEFLTVDEDYTVKANEGIFLQITQDGKTIFFNKIEKSHFPNITRLKTSLIKSCIGLKIQQSAHLYDVILFYGKTTDIQLKEFQSTLEIVANQLAQYLNAFTMTSKLKKSAKEKEVMLKEIHHRVKNNLQTVSSLLYFKSCDIEDKELSSFFTDTQNRISAISFTHEKLLKANHFEVLDIKSYLDDLISSIYNTYENSTNQVTIIRDIASLHLSTDVVMNLGLIVNELLSNALQHAFTGDKIGTVKISFKAKNKGYELMIEDNGVGLQEKKSKKSVGLQLVEIFVDQLKGKMQKTEKGGLSYKINF